MAQIIGGVLHLGGAAFDIRECSIDYAIADQRGALLLSVIMADPSMPADRDPDVFVRPKAKVI